VCACTCPIAVRRAGTAPPGGGRQLRQITATPAPSTAGMAGAPPSRPAAADPEGTARCRWVLRLLSRAPRLRGVRPRVLEGTQVYLKGLESAVPCSMVLWGQFGAKVGSTTHAHASSLCSCVHMCIRRTHSRHARAAQRSRAVRAGKYTWGPVGKNVCPDGTARIDDLTACQAAAAAAGRPSPKSSENVDEFPKGCFSSTTSPNVYFNAHVTGATNRIDADILLLCAGTGVPALPARPADGIPARAPLDAVTPSGRTLRYSPAPTHAATMA
jgi:hypothetical protein